MGQLLAMMVYAGKYAASVHSMFCGVFITKQLQDIGWHGCSRIKIYISWFNIRFALHTCSTRPFGRAGLRVSIIRYESLYL